MGFALWLLLYIFSVWWCKTKWIHRFGMVAGELKLWGIVQWALYITYYMYINGYLVSFIFSTSNNADGGLLSTMVDGEHCSKSKNLKTKRFYFFPLFWHIYKRQARQMITIGENKRGNEKYISMNLVFDFSFHFLYFFFLLFSVHGFVCCSSHISFEPLPHVQTDMILKNILHTIHVGHLSRKKKNMNCMVNKPIVRPMLIYFLCEVKHYLGLW